jgi:RHS repeat-associated protein
MLLAGKHFDPVLGIDIHIIITPGGPIPIPHPHVGLIFDPFDYAPIIGSTISVNGVPRTTAGTNGRTVPGIHFPIGGNFSKPPGNEHEMFMGSATVVADGDPFSYIALPALSCHDIGMISPFRPRKKGKIKSMALPTSVILPIPMGMPVFVGGPPTISMMAVAFKFGLDALGKFFKPKMGQRVMDAFANARKKVFENMKPGFLKCTILRAEPVDIVTGEVVVEQQDFALPGRLPFEWNRHYRSNGTRKGLCGYGWQTLADARLEIDEDGLVSFYDGGTGATLFPELPKQEGEAGAVMELVDGAKLLIQGGEYQVRLKTDRIYRFARPHPKALRAIQGTLELPVVAIEDLCGNYLRFERHGETLLEIADSAGRRILVESHGGLIRKLSLQHPECSEPLPLVEYRYDEHSDLIAVCDALAQPYRFEYDQHHLIRHTDRNGLSFYYEFDPNPEGWRVVHSWGDGGLYNYRFAYSPELGETEITDSLGHVSIVKFDERLLPICEIDPLGGTTIFEYDDVGRTTAVTDPDGHRTEYAYDERGNLLKLTRPDGNVITTEFNWANKATRITDPNGALWHQEWDDRGLLTRQVTPLGAESRYEYDAHGQLIAFTNPRQAQTRLAFDRLGNLVELTEALGHKTRFTYDPLGNVTAKTDPLGQQTRYTYDRKGRLIQVVLPSGATVACGYDAEDNLVRYVDENSQETHLEYCGLGEIAKRLQPDGYSVQYHYDTEERLIGVTNQRGECYQLKRDPLGRIVEEVDYWGQARRYTYDAGGYLTSSTDPLGRTIQYVTDPLGRILKKTLPDGFAESFTYDANGNLIETKNAHGSIKREFDAEGRLIEEVQGTFTIKNTYDANGNRVARETSLGNAVSYEFDALDQVASIRINQDEPICIERDAAGRIAHERLSSHLSRRFRYSADGYLTEQAVSANESPLFATRFEYDPAGNLTQRSDSHYGTDVYRYDPLGRITEHLDPQRRITRYLNDPAGDRLRTHVVEGTRQRVVGESVVEGEWSREGEYAGTYYRFDRAGNLVERRDGKSDLHLVWDANQRLIESHANGTVTRYGYDPLGRRLFKETGDRRTLFYWDGDALVGESVVALNQPETPLPAIEGNVVAITERREKAQTATQHKVREYVYYPQTFEPLALIEGAGSAQRVYHYHNDPNGCPTRLTNASGEVRWGASYTAWGQISKLHVNGVDNPIRLQGQYEDGESGLSFNRTRYYEMHIGQFISRDLISVAAGSNPYQYAPNSNGWIDPLGLTCKPGYHYRPKVGGPPDPGLANFVNDLRSRGVNVVGTNLEIIETRTRRVVGEVDVLTNHAAIQYKHGSSSATAVIGQIRNRTEPFVDVPVVAFVEGAGGTSKAAQRTVDRAGSHVPVTNDIGTLVGAIK